MLFVCPDVTKATVDTEHKMMKSKPIAGLEKGFHIILLAEKNIVYEHPRAYLITAGGKGIREAIRKLDRAHLRDDRKRRSTVFSSMATKLVEPRKRRGREKKKVHPGSLKVALIAIYTFQNRSSFET